MVSSDWLSEDTIVCRITQERFTNMLFTLTTCDWLSFLLGPPSGGRCDQPGRSGFREHTFLFFFAERGGGPAVQLWLRLCVIGRRGVAVFRALTLPFLLFHCFGPPCGGRCDQAGRSGFPEHTFLFFFAERGGEPAVQVWPRHRFDRLGSWPSVFTDSSLLGAKRVDF